MRSIWRMAALAALVLVGSCDEKDSDFFTTTVGDGGGTLGLRVNGTPAGATVTVTRNGSSVFSDVVSTTSRILEGLTFGTYQVTVTPPAGYDCGTETVSVTINDATPDPDVEFNCAPPVGSFQLGVTGLGSGLSLAMTLDGPVDRTGQLGLAGLTFSDLPLGDYNWNLQARVDYTCAPLGGAFTLNTGGQQATAQVGCTPVDGSLQVAVSGATANVSYTGPETGGGPVGSTPVVFPGLTPGTYVVSIVNPTGFTCGTNNQQVTVNPAATTSVQFTCTPTPGTVNVTVVGGPATVQYTGPTPGSVSAGATATPVTGLAPGSYTFSIPVPPAGATCTGPVMINLAAGATASASFTCTTGGGLTSVLLDLPGTIPCPGLVPSGTYPNQLLNPNTLAPVGTTTSVSTIGSPVFCGTSPGRVGFGDGEGYRFGTTFTIAGQAWNVLGFGMCATSTFSGGVNLLNVTYRNAGLGSLGSEQMTTGPGCFWGVVPAGTAFVDVTASGALSLDINTIRFWR